MYLFLFLGNTVVDKTAPCQCTRWLLDMRQVPISLLNVFHAFHQTFLLELLEKELLNQKDRSEEPQNRTSGPSGCCCLVGLKRRFLVVVLRFVFLSLGKWLQQHLCRHTPGAVDPGDRQEDGDGSTSGAGHPRNFIFAKFNAWEYGGSEVLWAALASKIFSAVGGFGMTLVPC